MTRPFTPGAQRPSPVDVQSAPPPGHGPSPLNSGQAHGGFNGGQASAGHLNAGRLSAGQPNDGWYIAILVGVGLVLLVGLAKPAWAPRLALICLVLVAAVVSGRWLNSVLSKTAAETRVVEVDETPGDTPTNHHGNGSRAVNGSAPLAVAELSDPRTPIGLSPRGMQYVRFVGSERLWAQHRLNLAHQPHWSEIQSRVSPELWQALTYRLGPSGDVQRHAQLQRLLNEIERI